MTTHEELERFFESTIMLIAVEYDKFSKTIAEHQRTLPRYEAQALNPLLAGFLVAQIEHLQSGSKMDASIFFALLERVRAMMIVMPGVTHPQIIRVTKPDGRTQ